MMGDFILNIKNDMATKTQVEKKCISFALLVALSVYSLFSQAISLDYDLSSQVISLDEVSFASLPGDRAKIKLTLSDVLSVEPLNFTIDNPARIVLDFPGVTLNLAETSETIGIGMANSINAVEAAGRTRVVVNLIRAVSYTIDMDGNNIILNLDSGVSSQSEIISDSSESSDLVSVMNGIKDIDFRRGRNGEGMIIVKLSDPSIPIDMGVKGGKVIVSFIDTRLPSNLDRKLDVIDFATPVKEINTISDGNNVKMTITTIDDNYDHIAYQTQDSYTIELKPLTKEEIEEQKKDKLGYTGERLSLNFQDIEVRAVLQLLADFTKLNIVTSDTVTGNVTLRMKNVPWDQALDIILKSRGLGKRQIDNVIVVAPQEELANRERLELEANKQIEELAPLRTEFIQINYADATDLVNLIKDEENNLLSERGTVSIDERTNILIIQDISSSLEAIRSLIIELDVPVRQVLIESRIVNADETFAKDIGVRFGYSRRTRYLSDRRDTVGAIGGGQEGTVDYGEPTTFNTDGRENLMVDLPADPADASAFRFAFGKIGSYLLQLELSALIAEGRGEDISSPRVITANQTEAVIESGVQIPYQEATSSGATSVSFKDAVLSLRVTPQITPDDTIILDLKVNQDTVSSTTVLGVPAINTRNVATKVLVENGETVVLGGVYTSSDRKGVDKTPFFGDLPYLGFLFKRTSIDVKKDELLIFITPKILKDTLTI